MVTCPKCQAQNPDGASFCARCGAQLASAPAPAFGAAAPGDPKRNGQAVAALVLGLVGLVAWFIPLIGFPVTIVGLIMGVLGLKSQKKGMATAGIMLSVLTLIASIVSAIIGAIIGFALFEQGGF